MAGHSSRRSLPTKRKGKSSALELKMSLVADRLAMLQDDAICPTFCGKTDLPTAKNSNVMKLADSHSLFNVSPDNPRKHERYNQSEVITGDGYGEDGEVHARVQPTKKRRTNKSRDISNDALDLDHESFNATSNHLKKHTTKRMSPTEKKAEDNKVSAMKRAHEVQANLSAEHPSFIKLMSRSQVIKGFWLGLPKEFCNDHLSQSDEVIELVDEDGKRFNTNYLVRKSGLSGGWQKFAKEHNLREGDAVVFHLIDPTIFKVYIVREDNLGETDGAIGLLNLDTCDGQRISANRAQKTRNTGDYLEIDGATLLTSEFCVGQQISANPGQKILNKGDNQLSPSNSDVDLECEVLDGIRLSNSVINFEAVRSFENFNIVVDGLVIDSMFSDPIKKKYYQLCCRQRSILHENLLKGLNCNLVVGIITETTNITDAIKACNTNTSHADVQIWDETLKGFELLGMTVGFLRAKLNLLLHRGSECHVPDGANCSKNRTVERTYARKRVGKLQNKFTELKEAMEKLGSEVDAEIIASRKCAYA